MEPLPNVGMQEDLLEVPGATKAPREQPFQQGSADDHPWRPQKPRDQGVCPLSGVGFPWRPQPLAQRPPRERFTRPGGSLPQSGEEGSTLGPEPHEDKKAHATLKTLHGKQEQLHRGTTIRTGKAEGTPPLHGALQWEMERGLTNC